MSENNDQPVDPWAPPNQDGVELSKPTPTPPPVHDQPTMASMPGAELPPPPAAPGGSFGYPTAPPTPTPAAGTPGYGYPPAPAPAPYPGYGAGYGGQPPGWGQSPSNGMGTAGMVVGIIAVVIFCFYGLPSLILGILALIFGIIGKKRVQRGEANNSGQATAGVVLGAIGIVLGIAMIIFYVWIIANADEWEESGKDPWETSLVVEGRR
ncbi:DUF4190 domain-containing protein [Streptomyces sp. SKN60]|uniref:DUF4190 domain-containing protein n=1 Tax=Streptomyces sp. SKN60 TaxID=2855506 RepID=UPI00224864D6|nr:DUF4190 domain-containing protein [Streptomyces sp. SKN60]MCX2181553.1 DUF4190 domain-containing protein [Streptomyces sp. SKN60]